MNYNKNKEKQRNHLMISLALQEHWEQINRIINKYKFNKEYIVFIKQEIKSLEMSGITAE